MGIVEIVFGLSLVATFLVAVVGRVASSRDVADRDLAGRDLNKWFIGLSAAATGNSGFIITGAVGLGYVGGIQWILLPLGWLMGDLLFWSLFPERLNRAARKANATTLSELLGHGLTGPMVRALQVLVAVVLSIFLVIYTSAQWLAGDKLLSAAFDFGEYGALLLFSTTIVAYSTLGGFRGSVYVDTMQAILSIVCTALAVIVVSSTAFSEWKSFTENIDAAGPGFLSVFPGGEFAPGLGVLFGFAGASVGFGLGQPQVISRYFAGSSPRETQSARWIYIGFIQFTWILMTIFGVILRGVMPDIDDPEAGVSAFFSTTAHPVVAGLIFAYIYAIIGSTANSIIVAVSQTVRRDVFPLGGSGKDHSSTPFWIIGAVGSATILLSFVLPGNVFTIATGAFSKIGAAIAGPVAIKVLGWRHNAMSLLLSVITGVAAAYLWSGLGYSAVFNEAGVGIAVSLLTNWLLMFRRQASRLQESTEKQVRGVDEL